MAADRAHLEELVARAEADQSAPSAQPPQSYVEDAVAEFERAGFHLPREDPVMWDAVFLRANELREEDEEDES